MRFVFENKKLAVTLFVVSFCLLSFLYFNIPAYANSSAELIGHWKLDEGSGTKLIDSSGRDNHLLLGKSADWQEGYLGPSSILFTEQVRASRSGMTGVDAITSKQAYTIAFWHKPHPTQNNKVFASLAGVLQVSQGSDHALHFDLMNTYTHASRILSMNKWNHIALTFANGKLIVYVNGEDKHTRTFTGTFAATGYFSFGGIWAYDTPNQLDDVRLYSGALSAMQVKQLATEFKPETMAPSVPENFKLVSKNNSAANLQWDAASDNIDVVGYELMLNGQSLLFTKETSATLTGLSPDARYYVQVKARDIAGNWSAPTVPLSFLTDSMYDASKGAIGINMEGVCDYCRESVFYDVFKSARPWMNWSYPDYKFDLDEKGNIRSLEPGREAHTMMLIGRNGHYKKGTYLVFYEGEGELEFWQRDGSKLVKKEPGHMVLNVQGDGIWFTLKSVNADNYIRNIRVFHEDDYEVAQKNVFRIDFIDRWKAFSVTRYMSMMATNNTEVVDWKDRTTPQHMTQAGWDNPTYSGVAIEYLVQLTNELGSDPWFNMPTMASDDYIRKFATYVRDYLHLEANIYIEYSNETWNNIFFQYDYCVAEGKKLGFSGSDFEIGAKYHAHRAKQMFRIWEDVFGGDERLVKVIGGFHYGGAHYANLILSHENVYQEADAYATAPYFAYDYGGSKAEWVKITSPTEIFADMALEVEQSNKMTKEVADKVSSFGLDTVAYEGGQHMAPIFYWQTGTFYQNDDVLVNKLAWLNRQPQMYDMYQKHFDGWKAAGGRLNVTFSSVTDYGRYGSFGLLEYADQAYDKAYKYRSTLDWSKSHPRWWGQVEVGAPGEAEAVYASPSELKIIRTNKTGLAVGWAPPVPRLGTVIVQQVKQYEIFVDGLSVGTVAADVTQFEWSGLKPNLAYQIGVKAHYADGGMSGQVYTNGRTRPDLQTPRTPTGLSANAVEMDRFGLTWNASSDDVALAGYEIFLNGAKVGTTNQLTYEISGLVAATPYNVSVRAMDEAGNRSGLSIRLLVRTAVDTLAPSTPGQLYAMNVNSRSVSLYWTPSVDNGKMSGYEVFVGGQLLTTVRDTQYTVGNLVSAKGYSFTVRAVDLAGNRSSFSHLLNQTTTADLVAPSTPNGLRMLRARVSVGELDLVWERSHDEDVVAHYLVYRNGQYLMKTTQPRAVVSGLVAGQTYSFTLRAVDASGNQSVESTSVLASLTELQLLKVVNSHTSGATVVQYRLAKDSYVTVRLFDQDNKYVSTPLAKTWLKSGLRMVTIKYTGLSDGRYRYEIEAEHAVVERLQGTVLLDRQRPMINNMTSSNSVTNESHRRITTVTFSLSERAKIRAQVLDGKGQIVFILADNVVMRSGTNQLRWNGINHAGRIVEDGLYTLKLTAVDDGGLSSVAVSVQVRVDTMTPTMSGWKTSNAKLKVKGDNRFVVTFMLSEDATVEAKLFNCDNQFLMNLPAGTMKRGLNSISWNGRGKEGKYVVNGNYYVQVKAVDGSNKSSGNMKLEIATEVEF